MLAFSAVMAVPTNAEAVPVIWLAGIAVNPAAEDEHTVSVPLLPRKNPVVQSGSAAHAGCAAAAADSTPPSVDEVGFGRRAAASVPLVILAAEILGMSAATSGLNTGIPPAGADLRT